MAGSVPSVPRPAPAPQLDLPGLRAPITDPGTNLVRMDAKSDSGQPDFGLTRVLRATSSDSPGDSNSRRFGSFDAAVRGSQNLLEHGDLSRPVILVQADDGVWAQGSINRLSVDYDGYGGNDGESTPPLKPASTSDVVEVTWTKTDPRVIGIVDTQVVADLRHASAVTFARE